MLRAVNTTPSNVLERPLSNVNAIMMRINVFKRFSGFTRIEVSHSVRSRAWSVRRQARFSHLERVIFRHQHRAL